LGESYIGEVAVERRAGGYAFGWWRASICGDAVKPHGHEAAHFMYACGGHYQTGARDGADPSSRAPFVFNPAQTWHADRFAEGPALFFALTVDAGAVEAAREFGLPGEPVRLLAPRPFAIAGALMREAAQWSVDTPLAAEALCAELLAGIGERDSGDRHAPRWLDRVVERLSDPLSEDPDLAELAAVAGVHPFHMLRTFRRFHRCTPGEFRRAVRLERAAALLAGTGRALVEVALETGFADQSHFTRRFRRAYGVTPAGFRRACGRLVSDKTAEPPAR
jgi:AraC family transcriptional regulator